MHRMYRYFRAPAAPAWAVHVGTLPTHWDHPKAFSTRGGSHLYLFFLSPSSSSSGTVGISKAKMPGPVSIGARSVFWVPAFLHSSPIPPFPPSLIALQVNPSRISYHHCWSCMLSRDPPPGELLKLQFLGPQIPNSSTSKSDLRPRIF